MGMEIRLGRDMGKRVDVWMGVSRWDQVVGLWVGGGWGVGVDGRESPSRATSEVRRRDRSRPANDGRSARTRSQSTGSGGAAVWVWVQCYRASRDLGRSTLM